MSDNDTIDTSNGAPLWRRFAALVYDSFLLLALTMLYGFITQGIQAAMWGAGEHDYQPKMGGPLFQAGWILTLAAFYVYFWWRAGQTVGMRAWRLKLTRADTLEQPSFAQSLLRSLLGTWSMVLLGIGYWWRWLDGHGDCLHDRWSGTRVVVTPARRKKKNRLSKPVSASGE